MMLRCKSRKSRRLFFELDRVLGLALLSLTVSVSAVLAQSVSPRTVGDGTAFMFSPGRSESYGIYSGDIGGSDIGTQLYTRHRRMGQSTGIGSSTLQTTSATSESASFQIGDRRVGASQAILSRPNNSASFDGATSPALNGYTTNPANGLSTIKDASSLSSAYTSGSLSGMEMNGSTGLFQDLNAVPLFSKRSHSIFHINSDDNETFFKKMQPQF